VPTFQTLPRHAALRDALRAHTRQQHERLHEHSCFLALFDQSLGIEEYRHLIQRLYGFYQPLDRAIGHAMPRDLARSTGYTYVSRARLLARVRHSGGAGSTAPHVGCWPATIRPVAGSGPGAGPRPGTAGR